MVRMRINRSATGKRRSHHALSEPRLSLCKDCGAKYLRHRACGECGKYRGRVVTDMEAKNAKRAAKKIAQIEGIQGAESAHNHDEKSHEKKADTTVSKPTSVASKTTTKTVTTTNK